METTRQNRISRLIQKELSDIFQKDKKHNYPNVLLTVTQVRVTPDLELARIFLSIFPANEPEEILQEIQAQKPAVRNELGKRVRHQLRKIPELEFYLDDSLDYIDHIDELLKK